MGKTGLAVATFAILLWRGTVLATVTPQQKCDNDRIVAWEKYQACIDAVVAKKAKGLSFDKFKSFWNCRHRYFKKWATFQVTAYISSTCIGSRYTASSGNSVIDNLTGLQWEKKDNSGLQRDKDNSYTWTDTVSAADGGAFRSLLRYKNTDPCDSGQCDWRLPTLAELQTILLDFTCAGPGDGATCKCTGTCVDPALDPANTQPLLYWSATNYVPSASYAWYVSFSDGNVSYDTKPGLLYVRAVRGGL